MSAPILRRRSLRAAALAAVAAACGAAAYAAAAGPSVPAPRIVRAPAAATRATAASFTFRDRRAGVAFECSLDGAAFRSCTSPRAYRGLARGRHRFAVRARAGAALVSAATTRTWTVDRTPPPAPRLTARPPAFASATAATFRFADVERGVRFACAVDRAPLRPCTSPLAVRGLAQGAHAFRVVARDAAGNPSRAATAAWRVDTVPPAPPVLTSHPDNPTPATSARFAFRAAEAGVTFRCQLDDGREVACASPAAYVGLAAARHAFAVRAVDPAGNRSRPLTFVWTVLASAFDVAGDLAQPVSPGAAPQPVDVRFANPYDGVLRVSVLHVGVRVETSRDGLPNPACDGAANLRVVRQYAGPLPLVIPPHGRLSLSELGIPRDAWPLVQMPDLPVNQDACKGTAFTLTFAAAGSHA